MNDKAKLKASDFMTSVVKTIKLDMTVDEAMKFLVANMISAAPIVNNREIVHSLASEYNLMKLSASGLGNKKFMDLLDQLPHQDKLIYVDKDASFVETFKIFLDKKVRRILVLDSTHRLQGIIARRDILRVFLKDKGVYLSS